MTWGSSIGVPYIDAAALEAALSPTAAVDAITAVLASGFDPASDIARSVVPTAYGQFLLMPSENVGYTGLKVVTVAPANPSIGLPRIQAIYLLFDAATMTLVAMFDGTALTTVRTPAVSFAAVRPFLGRIDEPIRMVVFGAGPQALSHVDTMRAVASQPVSDVTFIVRQPGRAATAVQTRGTVTRHESTTANEALAAAHIVVCATTAREPLFPATAVSRDAIVIAVGSHEPESRELGGALLAGATVIVEDIDTALREAGDVIMAIAENAIAPSDLTPMRHIVRGSVVPTRGQPIVFKSVGMPWQDLAIASAALPPSIPGIT